MRNYVRDYIINNVKVTFFAHGKNDLQRKYYNEAEKIKHDNMSFGILGIEAIKVSKMLVLADRVKSRDLYDLMILMRDISYSINDALLMIKEISHLDDSEHYRAVMTGTIPLDENDEGLMPVNVDYDTSQVYAFFEKEFEKYDIKKNAEIYDHNST